MSSPSTSAAATSECRCRRGGSSKAVCSNAPITACATTRPANASECRRTRMVTFQERLGCVPSRSSNRMASSGTGRETLPRLATVRPPRIREIADPAWETADTGPMPVPANTLLLIENLLDITHFYPLHDGNIGDVENSRIPVEIEEGTSDGNAYVGTTRAVRGYRQPPYLEDYLGYDFVDRDHTHFMLSPAVTRVEMRVWPAGGHGDASVERGYLIVHTHTPVDRKNHVWRLIINMPAVQKCKSDPTKS